MSEPDDKQVLLDQAALELLELGLLYELELHLDVGAAMMLVAGLQLALRHPANQGIGRDATRKMVDQIIETVEAAGLRANAELLRLGDNPAYDDEVKVPNA